MVDGRIAPPRLVRASMELDELLSEEVESFRGAMVLLNPFLEVTVSMAGYGGLLRSAGGVVCAGRRCERVGGELRKKQQTENGNKSRFIISPVIGTCILGGFDGC